MEKIVSCDLENLWDRLLSRDPHQVRDVFFSLTTDEQNAIRAHLIRMVNEEGWHPEQNVSAKLALEAISQQGQGSCA